MAPSTRAASHAGSWYTRNGEELNAQLDAHMRAADTHSTGRAPRALIGPHAGYSYSAPTAAHAYKNVDPSGIERVFVLGPSHHLALRHCALPCVSSCDTPLGSLPVDTSVVAELHKSGLFSTMDVDTDEDEHSIEMHLPFVRKVFGDSVKVVPILVGRGAEQKVGRLLAPFLADARNFVVVSTDFCHWGRRFRYQHVSDDSVPLYKAIEKLDRAGMAAIESGDPAEFERYLDDTSNTICGRRPILILMHALRAAGGSLAIRFVHYAQSSACTRPSDSSVSYAAALVS